MRPPAGLWFRFQAAALSMRATASMRRNASTGCSSSPPKGARRLEAVQARVDHRVVHRVRQSSLRLRLLRVLFEHGPDALQLCEQDVLSHARILQGAQP